MSDLQVIYDPSLEIGAIIDLDTNMGWGPMCPGPRGGELLQAFVDGMPFDLAILQPEQARDIFMSVFRQDAADSIQTPAAPAGSAVEPPADPVATAAASGAAQPVEEVSSTPPEQSADTDMAADASQTDTVTSPDPIPPASTDTSPVDAGSTVTPPTQANCLVCNANGQGSTNPACVVCGGTGKVAAAT